MPATATRASHFRGSGGGGAPAGLPAEAPPCIDADREAICNPKQSSLRIRSPAGSFNQQDLAAGNSNSVLDTLRAACCRHMSLMLS